MTDTDVMGPIDYLAVEFPQGRVDGEGFRLVADAAARGIIRVLDLEFLHKSSDGSVSRVLLENVEHGADLDITVWQGVYSGLLDDGDIEAVAEAIAAGSLAGILVYESIWAAPLLEAVDSHGARIVGGGRVAVDDVLAALDTDQDA